LRVTEELREHLKGRLGLALGRFGRHIGVVHVYLRDANGPRGGLGRKCRIVVWLRRGGRVVVTGVDTDASAVITSTASRAGFAVRRHVKRKLARRRSPRSPLRRLPRRNVEALSGVG
jgi:hypothetical protein